MVFFDTVVLDDLVVFPILDDYQDIQIAHLGHFNGLSNESPYPFTFVIMSFGFIFDPLNAGCCSRLVVGFRFAGGLTLHIS